MATKEAWLRLQRTPGLVKMPLIWTPTTKLFNEERDAEIVAALKAGVSTKELATMHGVAPSRIHQISRDAGINLGALRAEQRRRPRHSGGWKLGDPRIGHGAKEWWAQFTPEERSEIMSARQLKRRERERSARRNLPG